MTPFRLEEIRQTERKATLGPWHSHEMESMIAAIRVHDSATTDGLRRIAYIGTGGSFHGSNKMPRKQHLNNAAFMALSRQAVPELLLYADRLRAALTLCQGSIHAAVEKGDDSPLSADTHLQEALAAAKLVLGSDAGGTYPPEVVALRREIRG